jgi:hypothetical protein
VQIAIGITQEHVAVRVAQACEDTTKAYKAKMTVIISTTTEGIFAHSLLCGG